MRLTIQFTTLLWISLLAVGCSTSTPINFNAPGGTVLFVDGTPHHLPGSISLIHPTEAGESKRYNVSVVTTLQQQEFRAGGYIDVFGYTESDLDKTLVSTCVLDEQSLMRINDKTTVVFQGQTASRQHLYDLTLKKP